MKASLLGLALLAGCFVSGWAQSTADVVKRVDEHYNHLTSLRTQFTERYTGLGMDRTETGTLYLRKPGRMRWDYSTPVGKVFLLDGKFAWSYTPGESQAERMPAKEVDDLRSPLRFLLGHTELTKELDRLTITKTTNGYLIAGVPRGMAQRVKELALETTGTGQIRRIRLEEMGGATTEFSFENSQEDLKLPDALFHFSLPAGVTVVDGLPPV